MKISEEKLKEIAEQTDGGAKYYLNLRDGEDVVIPVEIIEEEIWEDEIRKVEEQSEEYYEIKPMRSNESFRIMEDFAAEIAPPEYQERLLNALSRPKPFQNFKYALQNSSELLKKWYAYKSERYLEWVKHELRHVITEE